MSKEAKRLNGDAASQPQGTSPREGMELIDIISNFRTRLEEILTPSQFAVISRRLDGKEKPEIMDELFIGPKEYTRRIGQARARYEEQLFHPNGLERTPTPAITEAARRGTIWSVRFLGRYYTTAKQVEEYVATRARRLSHAGSPGLEYRRLTELAGERGDYRRLLTAVQNGQFGEKIGRFWYVKRGDDYDKFLAETRREVGVQFEEWETVETATPFSKALVSLFRQKKYNYNRVAAILGLSTQTTRGYLNGENVPNEVHLEQLLILLYASEEERRKIVRRWDKLPVRRRRGH